MVTNKTETLPRTLRAPRGCCYYRLRNAGKPGGEPAQRSSPAGRERTRIDTCNARHGRARTHTGFLSPHTIIVSPSVVGMIYIFLFTVKLITLSFWRFKFFDIQTEIKSSFLCLPNIMVFKKIMFELQLFSFNFYKI